MWRRAKALVTGFVSTLLFDANHRYTKQVLIPLIVIGELVLSTLIVRFVKYTEIDWVAYMQEVEGVMGGEFDYSKLRGDTGPLVYPAGFVYLYSFLHYITNNGLNVKRAQYIFVFLNVLFTFVVARIYTRARAGPPYLLIVLCASHRIHSIFVLRLFNDCWALLLLYVAVWCFVENRWSIGLFVYSLAVSIKMNVLLYAPFLLMLCIVRFGVPRTVMKLISFCAIPQLLLGAPFLSQYPLQYLRGSFDLGRQFEFKWTVNFKFLPVDVFLDRRLHVALLVAHVIVLAVMARKLYRHFEFSRFVRDVQFDPQSWHIGEPNIDAYAIVACLFISNFVGIVFVRSIHYQFYTWYFHTLPFLLWSCPQLPTAARFAILAGVEYAFNVYPATPVSSLVLVACHVSLLAALLFGAPPRPAVPAGVPVERPHDD